MSEQNSIVGPAALASELPDDKMIYWLDFLVRDAIVIEIKVVECFDSVFETQTLTV